MAAGRSEPRFPPRPPLHPAGTTTLTAFLVLRAFANGCTAMTGVEAVSNGVPAFRPPEEKNAAATLLVMAGLCVTLFMGITLLAHVYQVMPMEQETVVSQLARAIFGGRGVPYYLVQAATMLILVLAANTAYSDFPRLASIVARDKYLPRQFMNQGDRLAFSNGIVVLSVFAGGLMVLFGGDTHALIPLYMVGVFVSFTLSQTGMVVRWRREGGPGWRRHAAGERGGGRLHLRGARHRGGHEVRGRGLDHPRSPPHPRPPFPLRAPALRRGGRAAVPQGLAAHGPPAEHRHRPHQRSAPRGGRGPAIRPHPQHGRARHPAWTRIPR